MYVAIRKVKIVNKMNKTKLGKFTFVIGWLFIISQVLQLLLSTVSIVAQGVYTSWFFKLAKEEPVYYAQYLLDVPATILMIVPFIIVGIQFKKNETKGLKAAAVWLLVLNVVRAVSFCLQAYLLSLDHGQNFLKNYLDFFSVCTVLSYLVIAILMVVYIAKPDDYERTFELVLFAAAALMIIGAVGQCINELFAVEFTVGGQVVLVAFFVLDAALQIASFCLYGTYSVQPKKFYK